MPRYQLCVTVSADGYIEVEADDAAAARKVVVRNLEAKVEFSGLDVNTEMFPERADIQIHSAVRVEEEA